MKKTTTLICAGLIALLTSISAHADVITFEGVASPGGIATSVAPYTEGRFIITEPSGSNGIASGSNAFNIAGFTSDWFGWDSGLLAPQITLAETGGSSFDLISLEIGNSGTSGTDFSDITLTGNIFGGGTVSQTFFGITSATLVSPVGFTNLASLDISAANNDAGIDNITLSAVPEPSCIAFLALAAGVVFTRRRRS